MTAYRVKREHWTFKLAPQLVGMAQQAYAGMATIESGDYDRVKEAILRRYDMTEESYHQWFLAAKLKPEETNRELAWTSGFRSGRPLRRSRTRLSWSNFWTDM